MFARKKRGKRTMQDNAAIEKRKLDSVTVARLKESYDSGWLHNVLGRITPLTLRRREDYIVMADIFIASSEQADHLLDRFDGDLELFCSVAEITVTKHMTAANVSEELRAHVELYTDVANLMHKKWGVEKRDPIRQLVEAPIMLEATNPFIKDFVDSKFNR